MSLLTPQIINSTPAIGTTANLDSTATMVTAHFFIEDIGHWFLIELSPNLDEAFCYVLMFEAELGYVSLKELVTAGAQNGYRVKRDENWKVKPVSEVMKKYR
jgi:hypothetical protein